jgi:predicted Zn-dependent protease
MDEQKRLFTQTIAETMDTLTHTGYSREHEVKADANAMALLARAGYQPSSLIDLLKILTQVQSGHSDGWYATHPTPSERIIEAEKIVRSYRVQDTSAARASRFRTK